VERKYLVAVLVAHVAETRFQRILDWFEYRVAVLRTPHEVVVDVVHRVVRYDKVSFAYDDGEAVLDEVSFDADPGETVALVGPTGSGKSTTAKILLRLYDVTGGAVRVDGHDVREVTTASLRQSIGYVSQDTFLFDGTITANIRYGQFEASDDELREAARAAQAHEFITELPDGYETRVGERGVELSGGQQQRIAIARMLLQVPEIVVLDEATASVDTKTELAIQRSVDRLTEDRTTIAIAHRLSTIKDADRILVLEDGRIIERGTHSGLLERDGLYAMLWSVQAGETEFAHNESLAESQYD
jgi:ATP-binding cassette subfamily B protein